MLSRKTLAGASAAAVMLMLSFGVLKVLAQTQPAHSGMSDKPVGKEVTLKGRIVDLHCFITGEAPSTDLAKCTADCIRAGVPAGLETPTGLVILGEGTKSPAKMLADHAYQEVSVAGKLYEKAGVKYLDIEKVESGMGAMSKAPRTGRHSE